MRWDSARRRCCATTERAWLAAAEAVAEPRHDEIDPDHLSVAFRVRHAGYHDMIGRFTEGTGSLIFDEAGRTLSDVRVTILIGLESRRRD